MGGATTPRRPRAASRVAVVSALGAALLLVLTACGGKDPNVTPSVNTLPTASASVAPTVSVTGLPSSIDVKVSDGEPGTSPGSGLEFVSPVYTLGPSGPLGATASVSMELDHSLPEGTTLVVGTRGSSTDAWTYLPAKLSSDLRHGEFTTDHFSQYGILSVDATGAISTYKDAVHTGLESTVDPDVEKPACTNAKGARTNGFRAKSWPRETLAWCLGLTGNDKHVLEVVNRREFPVQVDHGDASTISSAAKAKGEWTTWLGLVGPGSNATFLAPGGTATYDAEVDAGSTLLVKVVTNARTQSTRALYVAISALVSQVEAYGSETPTATQAFAKLVARPQCADALGQGSDLLVEGCLSPARLSGIFGGSTRLLRPVLTAPGMKKFWARQFAFLATQDEKTDSQQIVVSRKASDFGDLVGRFTGHTRILTVSKSGLVTERLDDGTDPVIGLTYQLSDPVVSGGTTTASSVLTKVTVYNRDAIGGNPPKVGDTGMITFSSGIVTPPYLETTYCDSAAAAKGRCGA